MDANAGHMRSDDQALFQSGRYRYTHTFLYLLVDLHKYMEVYSLMTFVRIYCLSLYVCVGILKVYTSPHWLINRLIGLIYSPFTWVDHMSKKENETEEGNHKIARKWNAQCVAHANSTIRKSLRQRNKYKCQLNTAGGRRARL